jgi:hypothetical protein
VRHQLRAELIRERAARRRERPGICRIVAGLRELPCPAPDPERGRGSWLDTGA